MCRTHSRYTATPATPATQADRLITCHKTYTNSETHRIVLEERHTLPAYESGEWKGAGPRYCPSLFSKVERFPERQGHMVWLEPEGIDSNFVYPSESQWSWSCWSQSCWSQSCWSQSCWSQSCWS